MFGSKETESTESQVKKPAILDFDGKKYNINSLPKDVKEILKGLQIADTQFKMQQDNLKLIDIGCGNGRDSIFFANKNIEVLGIDSSRTVIKLNNHYFKNKNISFKNLDIEKTNSKKLDKFDIIYSRFFLHAINKSQEKKFFNLINVLSIKNKTYVMLEFRTTKDKLLQKGKKISNNENFTDHYRRFIDTEALIKKIKKINNFKIVYFIERKGLSKYKYDNPTLARLILKKNKK